MYFDWLSFSGMVALKIRFDGSKRAGIINRDVINWQNNRHSMTTLVSGLGWPDGNTNHPYAHTYSSYVFNLDVNSIDVYVRSSDDNYVFEPDFRIYTENRNKEYNKIVMPINNCKTQAYFNLGAVKDRSPKACYITDDIVHDLKKYVLLFGEIRSSLVHHLEKLKLDLYENLADDLRLAIKRGNKSVNDKKLLRRLKEFLFEGESFNSDVAYLLRNKNSFMYMQFSAYLQQICKTLHDAFLRRWPGLKLRVHFRYAKGKNLNQYSQLCLYGKDFKHYIMRELEWGELLEKAYEVKRPLIASVNAKYCGESFENNKKKSDAQWTDFITVIPKCQKNYYIKREKLTEEIQISRPLLTFGVTVYREEDKRILYILDYLRIDEIIGDAIKEFLYYFQFPSARFESTAFRRSSF